MSENVKNDRLRPRLEKFDKIIFDMDGVITSEYMYWEAAALTVYELLFSYEKFGRRDIDREYCLKNRADLVNAILCHRKTVAAVKALGVNTNWDLAYIIFCVSIYKNHELENMDEWHFESVRMFIENIETKAPELYDLAAELASLGTSRPKEYFVRGGDGLWKELVNTFQRWFLGDTDLEGLNAYETPLLELNDIKKTLESLKNMGARLGIGTGRPRAEIMTPLKKWGIDGYFEPGMIATYDDVLKAEKDLSPELPIAKPHPYVFIKAVFGEKLTDKQILDGLTSGCDMSKTLVVGDAPSDLMAAKTAGMKFFGVLSGVDKESARKYFRENGADYIFDDITYMV